MWSLDSAWGIRRQVDEGHRSVMPGFLLGGPDRLPAPTDSRGESRTSHLSLATLHAPCHLQLLSEGPARVGPRPHPSFSPRRRLEWGEPASHPRPQDRGLLLRAKRAPLLITLISEWPRWRPIPRSFFTLVSFRPRSASEAISAHPFVDSRRLAAPFEVGARIGGLAVIHEVKADDELGVGTLRLGYRREDLDPGL